jgi:hypothetical protein
MGQRANHRRALQKLYEFAVGQKWGGDFDRASVDRYLRPMIMPIVAVFISFIPLAAIAVFHLSDSNIGVGLVFVSLGISMPAFALLIFRVMVRVKPKRY